MGSIRVSTACGALFLLAWLGAAGAPPAHAQAGSPNIALIILDDVGVEVFGAYNRSGAEVVGATPVEHRVTPHIDALAEAGLVFENAWSAPRCRATRASLATGTYGFRNGAIVQAYADPMPPTLPERLAAVYPARAAIGKWHLSAYTPYSDLTASPTALGFTRYAGSVGLSIYFDFEYAVDPPPAPPQVESMSEYITDREIADAIAFVEQPHTGPWLLWLALHAAHSPWDEAETPLDPASQCNWIANTARRVRCRQLEILDAGLGELFDVLEARDPGLANTTVILLGDNGSPEPGGNRPKAIPGMVNRGAKDSLYEGGINVPLIVAGAGVAPNAASTVETTPALVHAVDVFATVLALAGVPSPSQGVDGVSFAAVLGGAGGARSCVYADGTEHVGATPLEDPANHDVAIRNQRYKLIRRAQLQGVHDYELYDLLTDPGETTPLAESGAAFDSLRGVLDQLEGNPAASPCKPSPRDWSCGLGPELAAVLLALGALRRRRR